MAKKGLTMLSQEQFDSIVANYNEDYVLLLGRASQQHYQCLIASFTVLNDLRRVITTLYELQNYKLNVQPYPVSFRGNDELLKQLGFEGREINAIYGFLEYVKFQQGMEFEEALLAKKPLECGRPHFGRLKP